RRLTYGLSRITSPFEQRKQEGQQTAEQDRRRKREVKAEAAAADIDVARQPAERHTQHHQRANGGDDQADEDEGLAQWTYGKRQTAELKRQKESSALHYFCLLPFAFQVLVTPAPCRQRSTRSRRRRFPGRRTRVWR